MHDTAQFSDAEFMEWAGLRVERWAVLPTKRRAEWIDYLLALMQANRDPRAHKTYWDLANVIVRADIGDAHGGDRRMDPRGVVPSERRSAAHSAA